MDATCWMGRDCKTEDYPCSGREEIKGNRSRVSGQPFHHSWEDSEPWGGQAVTLAAQGTLKMLSLDRKGPQSYLGGPTGFVFFVSVLAIFLSNIILSASTCFLSYLWENLLVGKNLDPQPQPISLLLLPQTMYTGACLPAKYKDGSSLQPWWYIRWSLIHYPRLCLWSCLVAGWPRGLVAQWSLVIFSHPCHVLWDPISGGLSSYPPSPRSQPF